jgi:hypothetical protein
MYTWGYGRQSPRVIYSVQPEPFCGAEHAENKFQYLQARGICLTSAEKGKYEFSNILVRRRPNLSLVEDEWQSELISCGHRIIEKMPQHES